MERAKGLSALWAYLPTFRIVAELEHITQAAEVLSVSPSAVSRTISLLEGEIGKPLFDRGARRITLTASGLDLLRAVRISMRTVDDGLLLARQERLSGEVHLGTMEPFTSAYATGALQHLVRSHPHLVPSLAPTTNEAAGASVLQGGFDLAVVRERPRSADVVAIKLAEAPTAVYVGLGHATLRATSPREEVMGAPSVEVRRGSGGSHWPADWRRKVVMQVSDFDLALIACVESGSVAVLPVALAARHEASGTLIRFVDVVTAPLELWAITRTMVGGSGRAEAALRAVTESLTTRGGPEPS